MALAWTVGCHVCARGPFPPSSTLLAGTPLFTFGQGISYTNFSLSCSNTTGDTSVGINCSFTNTGGRDGDHVLLVFHRPGDDIRNGVSHPVPIKRLVDFGRATVPTGGTASLSFDVSAGVQGGALGWLWLW